MRPPVSLNFEPGTLNLRAPALRGSNPRSNNLDAIFLQTCVVQVKLVRRLKNRVETACFRPLSCLIF